MPNGLESGRVLSVCKHFPGHGDTDVDSHRHCHCLPLRVNAWIAWNCIRLKKRYGPGF